jgi:hypothetical protein
MTMRKRTVKGATIALLAVTLLFQSTQPAKASAMGCAAAILALAAAQAAFLAACVTPVVILAAPCAAAVLAEASAAAWVADACCPV